MDELILRPCLPVDIPELKAMWQTCFGDSDALISAFFRLLPRMGGGVAAIYNDSVAGGAYVISDMELVDGSSAAKCGYIYAVAVREDARRLGIGGALTSAAAALAVELGAEIICTLPAESSLYEWYSRKAGLHCALHRRVTALSPAPGGSAQELSAAEYLRRREALLSGQPHLRPGAAAMEFQQALCADCGGGLFAVGGGVAAAYHDCGSLILRELVCAQSHSREAAAAALGGALGARQILLCTPSVDGEKYIAADRPLPPLCCWNLSFD